MHHSILDSLGKGLRRINFIWDFAQTYALYIKTCVQELLAKKTINVCLRYARITFAKAVMRETHARRTMIVLETIIAKWLTPRD